MKSKEKAVAFFDFDKTIIKCDSFVDIIIYTFGYTKFIFGIIVNLPVVVGYILGLVQTEKIKTKLIEYYFGKLSAIEFESVCRKYSLERVCFLTNETAMAKIAWHKKRGHRVVIVSASLETMISPWADMNGIDDVIATIPDLTGDRFRGCFIPRNCAGAEKVRRIVEKYPNVKEYTIYAYGDSRGDKEMLAFADYPYYRKFF